VLPGRLAAPVFLGEKTGDISDEPVRVLGDRGFRPVAVDKMPAFPESSIPPKVFFADFFPSCRSASQNWREMAPRPPLGA